MENIQLTVYGKNTLITLPSDIRYKPKTGFDIIKIWENQSNLDLFRNKSILDIGTGDAGLLARYAYLAGAREVYGIDIDLECISFCKTIDKQNLNLSFKIEWVDKNFADFAKEKSSEKRFDVLVSNPPQLPCPLQVNSNPHDSSGATGRELIEEILVEGRKLLLPHGKVYMAIFDFLGIEECTTMPSIEKLAHSLGYTVKIQGVFEKQIRPEGMVEKYADYINTIYSIDLKEKYKVYLTEFCIL